MADCTLVTALLMAVASAPAWANDPALTTQQTAVGEAAMEMSRVPGNKSNCTREFSSRAGKLSDRE